MTDFRHSFLPIVGEQEAEILAELGIKSIDELFSDIPSKFQLKDRLKIPDSLSEIEVTRKIAEQLARNWDSPKGEGFLGGGVWSHVIPETVKAIVNRTEFLTAYTPYQAEISQGMLQALFEYQSLIAELVELPVVNASMYDWASALGESALMTSRVTKRPKFLVPRLIAPNRRAVLNTYTNPAGMNIDNIGYNPVSGQLDLEHLKTLVDKDTAGVYFENPAYLGYLQSEVDAIAEITHDAGALLVVGVDPISLGIIRAPGNYGADIVIGEGQPLGSPINMGGPLLGIFASRDERKLIRQLPGRIIGLTTAQSSGQRGFVMTIQAREQHIRREKATSNICSNQALSAVTAAIYLALLGPSGLVQIGETILQLRHYAERQLNALEGVKAPLFEAPHFKEFVLQIKNTKHSSSSGLPIRTVLKSVQERGILAGIPLDQSFPDLGQSALVCVTEVHTQAAIDSLSVTLQQTMEGRQ
ncbi:MAG: aminomethyl-transferring glycine dehydrogenase subunit GcvPA [Candidatus Hermodarchaeota archaeon]